MREYEFLGAFLNDEGCKEEEMGNDTDGKEEYYCFKRVTIDLECVESYFEGKGMHGRRICRVRTKSGDTWSLVATYDELKNLKKSNFAVKLN